MKKKNWKAIKNKEFKMIKALTDTGLSLTKVCEVTDRSWQVVSTIRDSKDLADYKHLQSERQKKYRVVEPKAVAEVKATNGATQDAEIAKRLAELNRSVDKLNTNVETLGSFLLRAYNESKLKKNKFFKL